MTDGLEDALRLVGFSHVALLIAGVQMPRALGLRGQIARLDPFPAHLFWTYYGFIGLCIVGFGALTAGFAGDLAAGTALGRSLSGFLMVFWAVRLGVQLLVFDARPYLNTRGRRMGYRFLTAQFASFVVVYGCACVLPAGWLS